MIIEFDPIKNAKNITQRGLSFDFVADFDWSTAALETDTRKDYGEAAIRLQAICKVADDFDIYAHSRGYKSY